MQQTKPFSFRRIRSFDEVLSDSFVFLRLHFRYLGRQLLIAVIPVLLLSALFKGMAAFGSTDAEPSVGINALAGILDSLPDLITQIITCVYIVLCAGQPSGSPSGNQVWVGARWVFWRIVGANIISILITGFATLLFVIPGIYVGVSLVFLTIVIVQEDIDVFSAVKRCFALIKDHWWQTFGILIVVFIILLLFYIIATLPEIVYGQIEGAFSMDVEESPVFHIISNFIGGIASTVIAAVIHTTIAIQYYSIVERKEAHGLRERVHSLEYPADSATEATGSSPMDDNASGAQPL